MKSASAVNGVLTICLTILGSAIALSGLILVSHSNLRAALRAQISINRTDIFEIRSEVAEIQHYLDNVRAEVARIEGTLLAVETGARVLDSNPLTQ